MNVPLVLLNRRRRGGAAAFTPAGLFALAEPGVWYDPSDLTTLFQDTAGTTPVTTPGQTVALALDKSKGLVLGSEQIVNGSFGADTNWTKINGATISGGVATLFNAATTPAITQTRGFALGRTYKVSLTWTGTISAGIGAFGSGDIRFLTSSTLGSWTGYVTLSAGTGADFWVSAPANVTSTVDNISVKELPGFHATQATLASRPTYALMPPSGKRNLLNNTNTLATQTLMMTAAQHTLSFRGTGTVTLSGASTAGPLVGTGANNIVSLTFTPTANNLTLTVSGTVNDAQLELGSARTTYQTVTNDGYNVTEAGVTSLPCLSFNGVNNFLVTPTITPGIDKAQVFAGVRKLSDAVSVAAEFSTSVATNAGSFALFAPRSPSIYSFASGGSSLFRDAQSLAVFPSPSTEVLTGLGDISGDLAALRVNGTQAAQSTTDQGTGNYLAYPLYIGRRNGATLGFNGQIFSLIVRFGTNLDAGTITSTETWVNGKTGAYA